MKETFEPMIVDCDASVEFISFHQDYLFPIIETGYHCRVVDPFADFEHYHDFYELTYCMSGSTVHIINGEKYPFPQNSAFIVCPGEKHYFMDFNNASALTICISPMEFENFLKAYSLETMACFQPNSAPCFLQIPASEQLYLHNLCENALIRQPLERTPHLKLFLGRVLSCLIQQQLLDCRPIPDNFLKALSDMNQLCNAREGISAFLRLTNLSHAHLCRLSKQYLNMTPHEYINNIRMQYAYLFVTASRASFEAIAEEIGFSSYAHFCKLFRERYHASPFEVRNKKS